MKIAFVGLGQMGKPMALNLRKSGAEIIVSSRSDRLFAEMREKGTRPTSDLNEIAAAEVIITCLPGTESVRAYLLGDDGLLSKLRAGQTVIDTSTISYGAALEIAKQLEGKGVNFLDAPISGMEKRAIDGTLTIMCGGTQATFDKVKPLFDLMGKNITLVGGIGDGQTCKVCNQIIVALNIEAVSEALVFASKAGADPAKVRQALMGGFAASRILEVHGERMIKRTFDPGFRIELHQKDLSLALAGARSMGVALPNTATAQELFNTCVANGGAKWDHSGMVKALERMANHDVAK